MIYADFPDPDVIRVEDTYYMISTTMHLMPERLIYIRQIILWDLGRSSISRDFIMIVPFYLMKMTEYSSFTVTRNFSYRIKIRIFWFKTGGVTSVG